MKLHRTVFWPMLLLGLSVIIPEEAFAYYDPGVQRWINRDPVAENGGRNLYAFVRNTPAGRIDPEGFGSISTPAGQCALIEALGPVEAAELLGISVSEAKAIAAAVAAGAVCSGDRCESKGHTKGARKSTQPRHEEGDARRGRDQGGEKGDARRASKPDQKRPGDPPPPPPKGPRFPVPDRVPK